MSNDKALRTFVDKICRKGRISLSDFQHLQHDMLACGASSREEIESLVRLDHNLERSDPAWSRWFAAVIVDFVVWGERPTGIVEEDTARWLVKLLTHDGTLMPTKTARLIIREIAHEAQAFQNDALLALSVAARSSRSHARVTQRRELQAAV